MTAKITLTDLILNAARERGYDDVRYERHAETARFSPIHRVEDHEQWKRMTFLLSDIHPSGLVEDADGTQAKLGAGLNLYIDGKLAASLDWTPNASGARETDEFFVV